MRGVYLLVLCCLAVVLIPRETSAMRGLCSRHWMTRSCYDLGNECQRSGGSCRGGQGDHGEGCACFNSQNQVITHYHGRGRGNGQG